MTRRAEMLERLRARHPRRLDEAYRVESVVPAKTPAVSGSSGADALWIGEARQIRVLRPHDAVAAAGLLLTKRHSTPASPTLFALAAILSSNYLAAMIWPEPDRHASRPTSGARLPPIPSVETIKSLPLPVLRPNFAIQLEVLWQYGEGLTKPDFRKSEASLRESFDRITAEIYDLTVDDLINFELAQNFALQVDN